MNVPYDELMTNIAQEQSERKMKQLEYDNARMRLKLAGRDDPARMQELWGAHYKDSSYTPGMFDHIK